MNGAPVRAGASLVASSAKPAPGTARSGQPRSRSPGPTRSEITVSGGKVSPAPGRTEVEKGGTVRLRVRSDRDDELHVHGYDKAARLPAGRTATLTSPPTAAGSSRSTRTGPDCS
ncbi:hypothetical protein SCALM49S_05304 [Streptomyces californicus]